MSRITIDEWCDTYKPISNPNNDWGGEYSAFETFTPDVTFVSSHPDNVIWTEIDSGEGISIVSGYHLVNRIQYYITEKPWTEDTEVPISIDKECDCMSDGDANIDCNECDGNGYTTIWIDTREEIEQIYGA
jgi:hypothetical protein